MQRPLLKTPEFPFINGTSISIPYINHNSLFPHLNFSHQSVSSSKSLSEMASIFRVFFLLAFLLALSLVLMSNARPLDQYPKPTKTISSFMARLKLDEESPNCWDSLIHLQSCTGELIMFFTNGETELGHGCCQAIRTISHQCWPTMIGALGFTMEETHVLEGYCEHDDDQSLTAIGSTKLIT